jgi:hypothetical protein
MVFFRALSLTLSSTTNLSKIRFKFFLFPSNINIMMRWALIYLLVPLINAQYQQDFRLIYKWKLLEISFPSDADRSNMKGVAVPLDLDVDAKG